MDRFSKTTEIDTAEITAATMEDDTPKKSKVSNIIALILCILIAIVVWMFVMETDTNYIEKDFDDVPVYSDVISDNPIDKIDIVVTGIRNNIIDIKASDIKLVLTGDKYDVYLSEEKNQIFNAEIKIEPNDEIVVTVIRKWKFS